MFFQGKLWAIQVHDNRYYTSKGVKIGNTAQEVLNKGHRIWSIMGRDKSLFAQIEKDNIYLYFQKSVTKSGQIGKYAILQRITIGYSFDIYEKLGKTIEQSENLSSINNDIFYSEKFNIELTIPNDWSNITKESNNPSVNELLFILNKNEKSSLLLIAHKLSSSKFSNGFDYLTQNKKYFPSLSNISDKPVSIANQEFYLGEMEVKVDGKKQKQLHYCTVKNQYAVIITGIFFDTNSEEKIKKLIRTIKAHNRDGRSRIATGAPLSWLP